MWEENEAREREGGEEEEEMRTRRGRGRGSGRKEGYRGRKTKGGPRKEGERPGGARGGGRRGGGGGTASIFLPLPPLRLAWPWHGRIDCLSPFITTTLINVCKKSAREPAGPCLED